ncbi:outer membrane protein assembly factor BamA [candidate division KSB1 bacterium]|nr:outer membrane protein assembly factor BamA [candidate division KSB1 bacterium]
MGIRKLFILLLLFALCSAVFAQRKTVKLLGVAVEGNTTTDANMIRLSAGLTSGMEITGDGFQDAVRQLWRLNLFSDIDIVVDREIATGVYIIIRVKEYPRLERVELQGNKKLKKSDIEEVLTLYTGQVINPGLLTRAKNSLYDKYREKGYLLAKIDVDQRPAAGDSSRVVVRFTFDEGERVQIKRIDFYGNKAFESGKLRKQFKDTKEDRWWRGADFNREKYRSDLDKLVAFYLNNGYRDAEVLRDSLYYNDERDEMYIDIWVFEGPRYSFGDVTWEGNELFTVEELNVQLPFSKGDVYSKEKLDEAVYKNIGSLYYDRGYIYATAAPREVLDGDHEIDLHFMISEGKQAKINAIHITGNTKTNEKVIRRELRIFPGQTFSRALLERSQRDVWMLNYFGNVEPAVNPVADDKVDLVFKVEEKSTDTANMSAGWSERDRLIGSVGVAMSNFLGNGQRVSVDANFGRYYQSYSFSFAEPWLFDTPTLAGLSVYSTRREPYYIGYRQVSDGGSIRIGRRLRWPDNFFRGDWIYRLDRTSLSEFSSYYQLYNPNGVVTEDWPLISSGVSQIINRNSLDRPEFPTAGSEFTLTTEMAGTILGGNVDYHKHTLRLDWFTPALWKLVFYTSFQAGYMEGIGKSAKIPYLEYFFMGGDGLSRSTPLRGYDDPLSGGTAIAEGGKSMLKYTAELRIPIAPNPTIFGLLFAEAGNVWPDFKRADPFSMKRSVGVGARIFMPMVGIIGFDYGYGFDRLDQSGNPDPKWKMHFVFGRSF